jgi:phytoene synthase
MGIATKVTADPVALSDAALIRARVQAAGSSFYWAMRFLPQARRDALFAIYAFCREVDDIADGDASQADKIAALDAWRSKIENMYAGRADDAITRSLSAAIATYRVRKNDFIAVVQGMEMDARGPIVAPPWAELDLYCDCVASAVGRLCVPVFGEATPAGDRVAAHLGRALQFTNILRDVEEDAGLGRLYLPAEALDAAGIPHDPVQAFAHPRLPEVMAVVGARAQTAFSEAEAALASCAKAAMRPAVIMMMVYRRHLDRLRENGWRPLPPRTGLARARANIEKLWIAIHYGLL